MSFSITKGNDFVNNNKEKVNPTYVPQYHLVPPIGWINDPNGFSYYQNQYHLFAQFYPYEPIWGPMHWGHWTTKDFLNWEWQGIALAPDQPYDNKGCFSGTAIEKDQQLVLMYTGVHEDEKGVTIQEQCIATSDDGIHFTKHPANPVIKASQLPEGFDPRDFRDPKVYKTKEGYRVVLAAKHTSSGQLLTYTSKDLISWEFDSVLFKGIGDMPECPDYFKLNNQDVLISCIMNLSSQPMLYPSSQPVAYLIGKEEEGTFISQNIACVDHGSEFYAPQTLRTPEGRQILIGWMHMWGHSSPTQYLNHLWCGAFTLPRELFIQNGELYQKPIEEAKSLRHNPFAFYDTPVKKEKILTKRNSEAYELQIDLTLLNSAPVQLSLNKGEEEEFTITYNPIDKTLICDRSSFGYPMSENQEKEEKPYSLAHIPMTNNQLKLQIFVDTCSVEVFVNGGQRTLTTLVYPKEKGKDLVIKGDCYINSFKYWDLSL